MASEQELEALRDKVLQKEEAADQAANEYGAMSEEYMEASNEYVLAKEELDAAEREDGQCYVLAEEEEMGPPLPPEMAAEREASESVPPAKDEKYPESENDTTGHDDVGWSDNDLLIGGDRSQRVCVLTTKDLAKEFEVHYDTDADVERRTELIRKLVEAEEGDMWDQILEFLGGTRNQRIETLKNYRRGVRGPARMHDKRPWIFKDKGWRFFAVGNKWIRAKLGWETKALGMRYCYNPEEWEKIDEEIRIYQTDRESEWLEELITKENDYEEFREKLSTVDHYNLDKWMKRSAWEKHNSEVFAYLTSSDVDVLVAHEGLGRAELNSQIEKSARFAHSQDGVGNNRVERQTFLDMYINQSSVKAEIDEWKPFLERARMMIVK